FHQEFVSAGLDLRFHTFGRPPQLYYPTLRELLLASDREGRQWSFLASEADYQYLRKLEDDDRIIPVVGNLGGTHTIKAIADDLRSHRLAVSAFYVSNVERYLSGDTYSHFVQNLQALPRTDRSVVIRSIFGGGRSVSVVRTIDEVIADAR